MSHLNRRQKMSKQKSLPSSHCCPVYPVTHWQLKEPHSPWQWPWRPQDGKPMLTQLLSVVRQPGELDWDSAGFPRSYSWGEVIEWRWRSGQYGDQRSFLYMGQHSFFVLLHTTQQCDTWKCDAHRDRNRNKNKRTGNVTFITKDYQWYLLDLQAAFYIFMHLKCSVYLQRFCFIWSRRKVEAERQREGRESEFTTRTTNFTPISGFPLKTGPVFCQKALNTT